MLGICSYVQYVQGLLEFLEEVQADARNEKVQHNIDLSKIKESKTNDTKSAKNDIIKPKPSQITDNLKNESFHEV